MPMVAATVHLLYDDTHAGVNHNEIFEAVVTKPGELLSMENVIEVDHDPATLGRTLPQTPPTWSRRLGSINPQRGRNSAPI
jgi:hypothetical protein